MFCRNCGKKLADNVNVCSECGYQIKNVESNNALSVNNENEINYGRQYKSEKNKKKNSLKISVIIVSIVLTVTVLPVILFVFISSLMFYFVGIESTPEETYNEVDVIVSEEEKNSDVEKLTEWKNVGDIESIISFYSKCSDSNMDVYFDTLEYVVLNYLANNRSAIYTHNINFINGFYKNIKEIDISLITSNSELSEIMTELGKINELAVNYYAYENAIASSKECKYFEGRIIQRIGDYENEDEYLDEYLFEYYGAYADYECLVIESEDPMSYGSYAGYLRYTDTRTYYSDGFEIMCDVYVKMTDREVQQYLNKMDNFEIFEESYNCANESIEKICLIVDDFARKNPIRITESNYTGTYVGGHGKLPFEYLHEITINDDGTFYAMINMYEGFGEYTGTYTKEGNRILCESDDLYFELIISVDALIYHNLLDYGQNCITDSERFVK